MKIGNRIIIAVAIISVVCLILGLPLMLLWNWLMPVIFGLPTVTFWQAVGLNLLSTLIFKDYNNSNEND